MGLISAQRKIYCFHVFVIWSPVILLGMPGRASCPEKSCVCVGGTKWPPSPSYILRPWVKSLASVIKEDQTLRTGDTEPWECRKHRWNTSRLSYLLHEPYGDHDWKCLPRGHTPPYAENPNFSLLSTSLDVGPNSVVVTLNCSFWFEIKRYIWVGGGYSAAFLRMGLPAGLTPCLCLGGLLSKLEVCQSPTLYQKFCKVLGFLATLLVI